MKNRRIKELDILRALSFIFVVEQHTMGGYHNIKGISSLYAHIFKFFYTLAKPAVSSFICISAISLCVAYSENFNLKQYYIKRLKYIFIPYITYSLLCLIYFNRFIGINDLFVQLIAGNARYHLWYMGMIIKLFIYFPIILFIAKKVHKQNLILRIVVFLISFLFCYYLTKYQHLVSNYLSHFLFENPTKVQKRITNISPLFFLLYFVLGTYIGLNYKVFKHKIFKLRFPIILSYIGLFLYAFLNEIGQIKFNRKLSLLYFIFSILIWYIISIYLSKKIRLYNFFYFISKYSFAAYLYHIFVIGRVVTKVRWNFQLNDWLAVGLATWTISSVLAPFLIKFISYIPHTQFITGIRTKNYNTIHYEVSSEL